MKTGRKSAWLLMLLFILSFSSCKIQLRKAGSELTGGIAQKADSLTGQLIYGAIDSLTSPASKRKIIALLDTLSMSLQGTVDQTIDGVLTKLAGTLNLTDSLVESLTGKTIRGNLDSLQNILVGRSLEDVEGLITMVKGLLSSVEGDSVTALVGRIRNELLGDSTQQQLVGLTGKIMDEVADKLNSRVKPVLNEEISFLGQHAMKIILLVGGLALLMIWLIWRQRMRYLKLVNVITQQIHFLPEEHQKVYDILTLNIKKQTTTLGLEAPLRNLLQQNGMLGTEAWESHKRKLKNTGN